MVLRWLVFAAIGCHLRESFQSSPLRRGQLGTQPSLPPPLAGPSPNKDKPSAKVAWLNGHTTKAVLFATVVSQTGDRLESRHSASPQCQQLGFEFECAGLDHADDGPKIPAGVSDAVRTAGDIIVVELQDIDDCCCRIDRSNPLDGLGPGTWVSPKGGSKEAPCCNDVYRITERVSTICDYGTRFDDQGCQRQMREHRGLSSEVSLIIVAVVTSLTEGFIL
jgi:hypothetical protein